MFLSPLPVWLMRYGKVWGNAESHQPLGATVDNTGLMIYRIAVSAAPYMDSSIIKKSLGGIFFSVMNLGMDLYCEMRVITRSSIPKL